MADQDKDRFYGVDLGGADRLHVSERRGPTQTAREITPASERDHDGRE